MTFGDNLKSYREKHGLSQKELANLVGVNTGTIAEWEADDSMPNISELARISKSLNVSSDVLLANSSGETVSPEPQKKEGHPPSSSKNRTTKRLIISIVSAAVGVAFVIILMWASGVFNPQSLPFSEDTKKIEVVDASVVKVFCYDYDGELVSTGSGFVAFDGKTIITNYHVISSAYSCKISTNQDISYNATKIACYSKDKDIAILELDQDTGMNPLTFGDSNNIKKGESVVAIGSPLGIKNTVSTGVLSGRIMQDNMDVLQFTAPISSGSSGGALFDDNGNVIGITFASYVDGQNLNLAIPIELANDLYNTREASKNISDIYLKEHPYVPLLEQYKNIPEITIDELFKNPEKYDSKTVKIIGYFSSIYSSYSSISNRYIDYAFIATANGVTGDGEFDYNDSVERMRSKTTPRAMDFALNDDCYLDQQIKPGDKICLIAKFSYHEFKDYYFLFCSACLAYGLN